MSEQYSVPNEFLEDLRTPGEILENVIRNVEKESLVVTAKRFDSEEEVREAYHQELEYLQTAMTSARGFYNVNLEVSGSGVFAPKLGIGSFPADSENEGFVVVHPENGPVMQPIDPFETREGRLSAVGCQLALDESGYHLRPSLILDLVEINAGEFHITEMNMTAYTISIKPKAMVMLDGSAEIKVAELEQLREKYVLADDIARNGLAKSLFIANLNKLRSALLQEHPVEHISMKNVKILQSIGRHADHHARKGLENSDIIVRSLLDVIGKGRLVVVSYEKEIAEGLVFDDKIIGRVNTVLMPVSADDETEPSLVLDYDNDVTKTEEMVAIPFTSIKHFRY